MDSNTQNPQPEKKQSFWAKLFGGGSKQNPTPTPPLPTPPASDPVVAEPTTPDPAQSASNDFSAPSSSLDTGVPAESVASSTSFDSGSAVADTTPIADEQPLPPINGPEESTLPANDPVASLNEEVPQADVSKVDEALNSLPPLPVTPDDPLASPAGEVPQPPVDPMVTPITAPTDTQTDDQAPTLNP